MEIKHPSRPFLLYLFVLMYVSMYICIDLGTYLCMPVGK